ncbi:MAG: helix-turn-helix domain-containing protein [Candidatus Caenarcaniphilales bacterium]|nr:helix-turn-helix domain-containing protein [Candidatus Caenarcaniphilales bacterium]
MSEALAKIGSFIKQERTDQGLSVKDLADKSRVSYTNIINIEEGIRDELPEDACLNGFIKILLKTLKIEDQDLVLANYQESLSSQAFVNLNNAGHEVNSEKSKVERGQTIKRIGKVFILFFLVVLVFGFILKNCSKKISDVESSKIVKPESLIDKAKKISGDSDEVKISEEDLLINKKKTEKAKKEAEAKLKKQNELKKKNEQLEKEELKKKAELKKKEELKKQAELKKEGELKAKEEAKKKELAKQEQIANLEKVKNSKSVKLKFEIVDNAWFQLISVDTGKVLYEGDVFPNFGRHQFEFSDKYGFVLASGNAAAFKVKDSSKEYVLGEKNQLIKWFYPNSAKSIYYQRREAEKQKESN